MIQRSTSVEKLEKKTDTKQIKNNNTNNHHDPDDIPGWGEAIPRKVVEKRKVDSGVKPKEPASPIPDLNLKDLNQNSKNSQPSPMKTEDKAAPAIVSKKPTGPLQHTE